MAIRGVKQSLILTEVARNEKFQMKNPISRNEIETMIKGISDDRRSSS